MLRLKKFFSIKGGDADQEGINMVDLMMWLVIAALLLATAIQGIAYFQKGAYIYQLKSAIDVAASRVMALATNDGKVDPDDLDTVVAEENANTPDDGITLTVDTISYTASAPHESEYGIARASFITAATTVADGETAYIRASHDNVNSHDVVFFFEDIASTSAGMHVVVKNGVGGGGTESGGDGSSDSTTPETNTDPTTETTTDPTPEPTTEPEPTVEPTPEAPADHNAASATLYQDAYYTGWWADKTVNDSASGERANFGFSISDGGTRVTPTNKGNYTVEFSGGENIGVASSATLFSDYRGATWYTDIVPVTGGFTEGTGKITAKVTNLTTNEVSYKTWTLTVVSHSGMSQDSYYKTWWTDQSTVSMASNATVTFGFQITNARYEDYDVVFTGGEEIGGAGTYTTNHTTYKGGDDWYATITPVAGGFTEGVGTITATATHKVNGKVFTETFQLTVTPHSGMSQDSYYKTWWTDQSTVSMASNANVTFGFQIANAIANDYSVTFTGGENIGGAGTYTANHTTYKGGDDWYATITPVAGGFTEGVGTITATATHKVTGKTFTETFQLTVTPHSGMSQDSYYSSWWLDKSVAVGSSTENATFGFQIANAKYEDYDVVFTGGESIGGTGTYTTNHTSYKGGDDWYATIKPVSTGFTAGSATITATATHKVTGKTFTKTYTLTAQ